MSKVWLVTHKNMSGEKYYFKVKADSRQEAKEKVSRDECLYIFTLKACRGERANIFENSCGYQYIYWDKE